MPFLLYKSFRSHLTRKLYLINAILILVLNNDSIYQRE